jgi:hypothetical protein
MLTAASTVVRPYVIALNPGEQSVAIGGSVRNAVNRVIGGPITYTSLDPSIATVNVCADTPTSGASINGTIDASDCYSGFATAQGRPDPNYLSDMFRISLTAGQQVTITLTADATFSPPSSLSSIRSVSSNARRSEADLARRQRYRATRSSARASTSSWRARTISRSAATIRST